MFLGENICQYQNVTYLTPEITSMTARATYLLLAVLCELWLE